MGSWGSYSINDVSAIFPVMFGAGALDNYSKDPELEKLIADGGATSDPGGAQEGLFGGGQDHDREGLLAAALHLREHLRLHRRTLEFKTFPDELPRFYFAKWK